MLNLELPPQSTTSERIADALRMAIVSGQISGGTALKQNDVAKQFAVSAAPVREAFQMLTADGLVVSKRNRGVVVARLAESEIAEIADLRCLLEGRAIRLSAPLLAKQDLEEAEAKLRAADATEDRVAQIRLHWEFHARLYAQANSPRLLDLVKTLFVNMDRYVMPHWDAVWLSSSWHDSHGAILSAIRRRKFERAATLIEQQIQDAAGRVLAQMRKGKQDGSEYDG